MEIAQKRNKANVHKNWILRKFIIFYLQAFLTYIRNLKILQYFRTKLMHLPSVIQATQ